MTPQEVQLLRSRGEYELLFITQKVAAYILYGMTVPLFLYALYHFWHHDRRNLRGYALLATTLICCFAATVSASGQAASASILPNVLHGIDGSQSTALKTSLSRASADQKNLSLLVSWTNIIMLNISDAALTWRAWHLLPDQRSLMVLPILLVIGSTATAFACNICSLLEIYSLVPPLATAQASLSLANNLIVLLMVGYRFWSHRSFTGANLGRNHLTLGTKVLYLLTEFGAIFGAFQTANFIFGSLIVQGRISGMASYALAGIVNRFFYTLTAVYPTVILVLVRSRVTFTDRFETLSSTAIGKEERRK